MTASAKTAKKESATPEVKVISIADMTAAEKQIASEPAPLSHLCFPETDKGKVYVDLIALTEAVVQYFVPVVTGNNVFIYNRNTGLYHANENDISSFINEMAVERNYNGKLRGLFGEVIERVRSTKRCKIEGEYPFDNAYAICFNNGVLEFSPEGKILDLKPFSPEYKLTKKIECNYNKNIDPKLFENEIGKNWLPPEKVELLYQPLAASIIQSMPDAQAIKRIWILLGAGNSGKSTYSSLLEYVVGKKYIGRLSLHQLCDQNNRFDTYTLIGKTINIGEDISAKKLPDVSLIKKITGSLYHDVERKGKDKMSAKLCVSHVFSANATPELTTDAIKDKAFWDRIQLVKFSNSFENDPNWVSEHFTEEIFESFIFNVIETVQKYWYGMPKSETNEETCETWVHYNDSAISIFLEEYTERSYCENIETEEFRKVYARWLNESSNGILDASVRNLAPTSPKAITNEMFRLGYQKKRATIAPNDRRYVYAGLTWKTEARLLPTKSGELAISSISDFECI